MSRKSLIQGCGLEIDQLAKSIGENPTDIINEIESELISMRERNTAMSNDAIKNAVVEKMTKNRREALLIEKRNFAINQLKKTEVNAFITRYMEETGEDAAEALKAFNVGSNYRAHGARGSVDAKQRALSAQLIGELVSRLRREGLDELITNADIDKDIAIELWELREGGSSGRTKNPEAVKAAKIIRSLQDKVVDRANSAGAWIKKIPAYIIQQSHNKEKILQVGMDEWKAKIIPLLDLDEMGKKWNIKGDDLDAFLDAAWKNLALGKEFKFGKKGSFDALSIAFKAPANRAQRMSAERVLEFKTPESWWEYHTAFGHGGILDNVVSNIDKQAQEIALMDSWGTNPDVLFDRVKQELSNDYRDNKAVSDKLNGRTLFNQLDAQWDEITGKTRQVSSVTAAKIGSEIRSLQSLTKLGMAVLSSFADIVSRAAELNYHGVGFLDSYGKSIGELLKGRGDKETREIGELIGVGFDGLLGNIHQRFHGSDASPGLFSNMLGSYFKINGLNWWTDANMSGTVRIMSSHLASNANKSYDQLSDAVRNGLNIYGIDAKDWEFVRSNALKKLEDGRQYIVTDQFKDLDAAKAHIENNSLQARYSNAQKYLDDIEGKLHMYYVDSAHYAVPTPSAKERAIMMQGTLRGTAVGEALRFIMQFKAFPITYLTKAGGRTLHGSKNKAHLIGQATHLILGMTAMGYLAMTAKDIAKGREPKDPSNKKTWTEAFLQGGGLGIYGDLLFAETNKFGQGALATLLGPTFATAEDAFKLFGTARDALVGEKEAGDALNSSVNFARSHLGIGMNLWFAKLGIDYMFMWNIQEALNPGSLSRMEQKLYKDYEQEYWLPPTEAFGR